MTHRSIASALACVLVSFGAQAADCDAGKGLQDKSKELTPQQQQFLKTLQERNPPCPTFLTVLRRLASDEKRGGFRLQDAKPVDAETARKELAAAMKNPDVAAQIETIRKTETDGSIRLALEAGVLDGEGFYAASGLKVAELKERLK